MVAQPSLNPSVVMPREISTPLSPLNGAIVTANFEKSVADVFNNVNLASEVFVRQGPPDFAPLGNPDRMRQWSVLDALNPTAAQSTIERLCRPYTNKPVVTREEAMISENVMVNLAKLTIPMGAPPPAELADTLASRRFYDTLKFSPCGTRLAGFQNFDGDLELWNLATGKARKQVLSHSYWVAGFNFSPSGSHLALFCTNNKMLIYKWKETATLSATLQFDRPIRSAFFSPSNRELVIGLVNYGVAIWDFSTPGGELLRWQLRPGNHSATLSADSSKLLISSDEGRTKLCALNLIWEEGSEPRVNLTAASFTVDGDFNVHSAVFSADGEQILGFCSDDKIRTWDAPFSAPPSVVLELAPDLLRYKLFSDATFLAVNNGGSTSFYDLVSRRQIWSGSGESVSLSPTRNQILHCNEAGKICLSDVA